MFSFRKEKGNEISNATRAILVKNKRAQASPAPLVKNKKVLYSSIFKNEYRTHYIRKCCFYKFYKKTF